MFYSSRFDPGWIIAQMVAMQSGYYILLGISCACVNFFYSQPTSLANLLSSSYLDSPQDYSPAATSHLMAAIGYAFLLRFIVQRAKKCLDFGCTSYGFAIAFTIVFDGRMPQTWTYWIVQLVCIIVAVSVGEYICMQKELEDIPVNFFNVSSQGTSASNTAAPSVNRSPGGSVASPKSTLGDSDRATLLPNR